MSERSARAQALVKRSSKTPTVRSNNAERRKPLSEQDFVVFEKAAVALARGKLPSYSTAEWQHLGKRIEQGYTEFIKLAKRFPSAPRIGSPTTPTPVPSSTPAARAVSVSPNKSTNPAVVKPWEIFTSPPNTSPSSGKVSTMPAPHYTMPATATVGVNSRQTVTASKPSSTRLTNKEMVGSYSVTTAAVGFSNQIILAERLNPANGTLFPWLNRIARNYEKYKFVKLAFTIVSNNSTNNGGWIAIGVDRDTADPRPTTKQELMSAGVAKSEALWAGTSLSLPTDKEWRFVEGSNVATDMRQVDLGRLYLAGVSDYSATLDVYVDYTIELSIASAPTTGVQTISWPSLFTQNWVNTNYSSGATFVIPSGQIGVFQFVRTGKYLVSISMQGSGIPGGGTFTVQSTPPDIVDIRKASAENTGNAACFWLMDVKAATRNSVFTYKLDGGSAVITTARMAIFAMSDAEAARLNSDTASL